MLEIMERVPLASCSTYHVGGPARFGAYAATIEELQEAIAFAAEKKIPYRVLGGGSNLLVSDDGYDGLIIWYKDKSVDVDAEAAVVRAGAGAVTAAVAGVAVRAGLMGFEWAAGVPGTIGGAVYGNAGASGGEMKDSVSVVTVFAGGALQLISNGECRFAYRHSRFKKDGSIIVSVELQLARAEDPRAPEQRMKEVLAYRNQTQPKGAASSGCVFKNYEPQGGETERLAHAGVPAQFLDAHRVPTGWLVEHAQLKGTVRGGARVSDVHGNFIVTERGATAADIFALIAEIKKKVREKFGIEIEEEITLLH